jgi:GTP-binding protein EngB required for normal cell division
MGDKPLLLIMGNSNVGKSTITRILLNKPSAYKGKTGKIPGSTLLIRTVSQPSMPFQIVDLPGFGYMRDPSQRREEHIKKQIVLFIEKNYEKFFCALVVINILRTEDELQKYYYDNNKTVPLTYELIKFLKEFGINPLIAMNKVDKVSNYDRDRIIDLLIDVGNQFALEIVKFENFSQKDDERTPILALSAIKKYNLGKLRDFIYNKLSQSHN